ncbi:MAG: MerR family transcriptional regulator [Aestuariivirgaceae bacterium]
MTSTDQEQKFSIGDLCREFDVTPRAVRFYQTKGILHPARRAGGLTRVFNRRDRARLKLTLRGKKAGFTLVEIKELLDVYDQEGGILLQQQMLLEKGREQVRFLRRQIAELTEAADELERDCALVAQGCLRTQQAVSA